MCSSTDKQVAASDVALQTADATAMATYQQQSTLAFGEQQEVLNSLNAKMSYMASNPLGYTPAELHSMTTSVNENTANAAKTAIGSAAAFAATHGAADTGSGPAGQLAGQIGTQAALAKAQGLNDIQMQSEQLKQQNYWKAISGLSSVGGEFGGAASTAGGLGVGSSNAGVGAGSGAVSADEAGIEKVGSFMSGIAGLGTAALSPWAKG
jgi:hypothetical protein